MDNRVKSTKLILMPPKPLKIKFWMLLKKLIDHVAENEFSEKNKIIEIREIYKTTAIKNVILFYYLYMRKNLQQNLYH